MTNKKERYTIEDDKIIKKCIEECRTYTEAFEKAAKKIGRSAKSISVHYYYSERKKRVLTLHDNSHTDSKSVLSRFIASVRNIFTF